MNAPNTKERQANQLATVIAELSEPGQLETLLSDYGQMSLAYLATKIENLRLQLEAEKKEAQRLRGLVAGVKKRQDEAEAKLKKWCTKTVDRLKRLEEKTGVKDAD